MLNKYLLKKNNFAEILEKNWVLITNSDFLIPLSLQTTLDILNYERNWVFATNSNFLFLYLCNQMVLTFDILNVNFLIQQNS